MPFKPDYTDRYYIDKILTDEDIAHLQYLYKNKDLLEKIIQSTENFFGIVTRNRIRSFDDSLKSVMQKLLQHAVEYNRKNGRDINLSLVSSPYFQEYLKNGHLPEHVDAISKNGVTLVTLVDRSQDLIGGEIILIDDGRTFKKEHNLFEIEKDPYTNIKDVDKIKVYITLPQEIGETAVYVNSTLHSISKVQRGNRVVLVTWFDTKKS